MTDEKLNQILKQALAPQIDDSEIRVYRKVRETNMKPEKRTVRRTIPKAAAIAVAVLAIGSGTVYGACRYFGLLDFTANMRETIPQEAAPLITSEPDQTVDTNASDNIIDCGVKEALCDSETIMIVYEVTAAESGKYLFIPTDCEKGDDMSEWSDISGMTAGEYASQNNLTIVQIGGGITNTSDLGIVESSLSFHSTAPDVMDIYVRSGKDSAAANLNVNCCATARLLDSEEIWRRDMSFALEDKSHASVIAYQPETDGTENGAYTISKAEVIQTELGTYVEIYYSGQADSTPGDITFHIRNANGDDCDLIEGSGVEFYEDGTYSQRFILNKSDLGDHFTTEIYDYQENQVLDNVQMIAE